MCANVLVKGIEARIANLSRNGGLQCLNQVHECLYACARVMLAMLLCLKHGSVCIGAPRRVCMYRAAFDAQRVPQFLICLPVLAGAKVCVLVCGCLLPCLREELSMLFSSVYVRLRSVHVLLMIVYFT